MAGVGSVVSTRLSMSLCSTDASPPDCTAYQTTNGTISTIGATMYISTASRTSPTA